MQLVTLTILAHADEPVGSVRLAEAFLDAGLIAGDATAGRYLRKLDRSGLTRPISTKGRLITEKGRRRLAELRAAKQNHEQSARIVQAIKATDIDEAIELLYVRRAVEAEAARLAAIRATKEEIDQILALESAQGQDLSLGETRVNAFLAFHRLVARASHNRMLIAVAMMLLDETNDYSTSSPSPSRKGLPQSSPWTITQRPRRSGAATAEAAIARSFRPADRDGAPSSGVG
jgi:DNA-binding GntR family transcriptional regulator